MALLKSTLALALALGGIASAIGAEEQRLNLFDWMGVAPVVVYGIVEGDRSKHVELRIERVIRGDLEPGDSILVNVRRVNRQQEPGEPRVKLVGGEAFLVLLQPAVSPKKNPPPLPAFDLVRGVDGAWELSPEGSGALLDAAETLAALQDRKDELATWRSMRAFLEETNPYLIETALDAHIRFHRGTAELLPLVRPLLDHPRADLRQRAARLIGQIVRREGADDIEERSLVLGELAARARRDPVVAVRLAATVAIDALWNEAARQLLEEIAEDDPDQRVRYAAERLIYARRQREAAGEESRAGRSR